MCEPTIWPSALAFVGFANLSIIERAVQSSGKLPVDDPSQFGSHVQYRPVHTFARRPRTNSPNSASGESGPEPDHLLRMPFSRNECTMEPPSQNTPQVHAMLQNMNLILRASYFVGLDLTDPNWTFNRFTLITLLLVMYFEVSAVYTIYTNRRNIVMIIETLCCYGINIPVCMQLEPTGGCMICFNSTLSLTFSRNRASSSTFTLSCIMRTIARTTSSSYY